MRVEVKAFVFAATLALAAIGATAACESRKPPAEQPVKTFVMPVKPVTGTEKAKLLAAVKEHVEAAQKAGPNAFADMDWNVIEYHRLGDFYKVVVPSKKVTSHQEVIAPAYTFRLSRAFKILPDGTTKQSPQVIESGALHPRGVENPQGP